MGYRYSANVTFPVAALAIAAVEQWLAANVGNHTGIESSTDGDLVVVADGDARSGEIDITHVLDENCVPYDHYHSEDCAGKPEPWTDYVRFDAQGHRVVREIREEAFNGAVLAEELIALLDAGDVVELRTRLTALNAAGPENTIDEIASEWAPPQSEPVPAP